jgi:hypothetical protein
MKIWINWSESNSQIYFYIVPKKIEKFTGSNTFLLVFGRRTVDYREDWKVKIIMKTHNNINMNKYTWHIITRLHNKNTWLQFMTHNHSLAQQEHMTTVYDT